MVARALFLPLLVVTVVGCSQTPSNLGLINRLNGRGAVLVSNDNPYLAANMLLEQEMGRSAELKGFLDIKGLPDALEVQRGMFEPTRVYLYYVGLRQIYNLEDSDGLWLIQGPQPITDSILKSLGVTPPFRSETVESTPIPLSTPTRVAMTPPATSRPADIPDLNQDTLPLAETSPRGDLVHYVIFPGETLEIIAEWYTGDGNNQERLARLNGFKKGHELLPGDEVIIPGYLAKNKRRYDESTLQKLLKR